MRKTFLYTLLLAVITLSAVSCTKEEVKPQSGGNNGGVQTSDKGF
jgi:hypothetical protein